MAKKTATAQAAPWQDLETQAYHAYREWPIWLALREKELTARLPKSAVRTTRGAAESPPPAPRDAERGAE